MSSKKSKRPQDDSTANPDEKCRYPESSNRHVYVEPGAQIDFVKDFREEYKTAQADQATQHDKQLFWTKIGAGLIFIYALITFWQACLTSKLLDTTTKQFKQAERPYIWLATFPKIPSFVVAPGETGPDGYIAWDWHYADYGKTPAYNVKITGTIDISAGAINKKRVFEPAKQAAPLPPNKDDFSTAIYKTKVTPQEFQRLMNIDQSIVVFGRINYSDAYGGQYETGFCFSNLRTGSAMYCPKPEENYIK
jgi:hypothetical protein